MLYVLEDRTIGNSVCGIPSNYDALGQLPESRGRTPPDGSPGFLRVRTGGQRARIVPELNLNLLKTPKSGEAKSSCWKLGSAMADLWCRNLADE